MSLIRLRDVGKRYEDRPVLREAALRVKQGERIGLIGPNGSGKTTILRLVLGEIEPDEGSLETAPGVRIGYFSQFSQLDGQSSVVEVLEGVLSELIDIERQLAEIEDALGTEPSEEDLERLLERQAELLEEMDRRDGWTYSNRIDTVLTKLGFDEQRRQVPIEQLSGGWRNRAALARILLEDPDVLLLDEPTNYLDIEGVAWLEQWLTAFKGAMLLVSHDRDILDRVATRIVEIQNYHLHVYEGGFTQYVREKPLRLKTLVNQFKHEEELLAYESEALADRQEAMKDPGRALKRKLADIKKSVTPRPVDKILTSLYERLRFGNQLLKVEGLSKSYGSQTLFQDLSWPMSRGDRITVLGPNGCGKTTLLRVLSGEEPADAGRVVWGKNVECISFNQTMEEMDDSEAVPYAVKAYGVARLQPHKLIHRFLEMMQFSERDLTKRVGELSGGQRARVALARCLLSGAGVLLLDEPTNHLDLTSCQVMERALIHFPGAVLVVSHDRFFIDKVATGLLVFEEEGRVAEIHGNYAIWKGA